MLLYVAARSSAIAITIDEALTFLWHVPGSVREIVLLRTPGLEDNNHVLLTLLVKGSTRLFGVHEWAIRLPSILGYAMFLVAAYFILSLFGTGWLRVLGLIAMGINPYLVDYFTVARGYGLALGLAMSGIALLLYAVQDGDRVNARKAYGAFLLLTMAAIAQLTFALPLAAAYAVLWGDFLWRGRGRALWETLRPRRLVQWLAFIVIGLLQGYVVHLALVLKRVGLLAEGHTQRFWSGTVGSLIDGTLPEMSASIRGIALAGVVATIALAAYTIAAGSPRSTRSRPLAILLGLLLAVAALSLLQHVLLGVGLLNGRRGLALLALFLLCALALPAVSAGAPAPLRVAAVAAGAGVPALLAVHGIAVSNFDRIRDWPHDAAVRAMMLTVREHASTKARGAPLHVRAYWPLVPAAEFYRVQLGLEHTVAPMTWSERPGYLGPADLYYVLDSQRAEVLRQGTSAIREFPVAGTVLVAAEAGAVDRAAAVEPGIR